MHIRDILERDTTTISFEFFPPRSDSAARDLAVRLDAFKSLAPSFVSVTYGAGGSTRQRTHDLVVSLKASDELDPVPHLTCVMQTGSELDEILARYAEHAISNILVMRGDAPEDVTEYDSASEEFPHAADLVRRVKAFAEVGGHSDPRGFGIGVAGFPEGHPETPNRLKHMDHLKAKVDAGADWITTQMFFDNRVYYDWCEQCELNGIDLPKIAGIMPITSLGTMKRMAELAAGTNFPARLQRRIHKHQDEPEAVEQIGVQWASEQCNDLLDQGVRGLHFYTLNRSDATMRIFNALGAHSSIPLRGEPT
ncbi:MAG: methylenetetrahydrofolate reductase [NAD(P)H] [Planctomycetota bacterium]|nr:methylenetetrahydrofolate reductase [NAD(P)H] [Planctomycetota bacterium]